MERRKLPAPPRTQLLPRHAVTLLELLLVLAVLTLVGAVAWPSLDRSFADQRLRNAADMVRAQWTQAQVRAIASGTVQYFQSEAGGRHYWLESADDADAAGNASSGASLSLSAGVPSDALLLPDNVTFDEVTVHAGESCDSLDAYGLSAAGDSAAIGSDASGTTIAFYPDGACSSVRLVLRNSYDQCIAVSLHGLTGLATLSDVFAGEDASP
ncbi:MAG: hypothetical protein U1E05_22390 [Patescibacteria group bacterium]|nr:hypothetical protein [Patescibacteria group bacterium]